jgi:hypothetical protein
MPLPLPKTAPYFEPFYICAQGGIRTPVALRAADLQSAAFDRSATYARFKV